MMTDFLCELDPLEIIQELWAVVVAVAVAAGGVVHFWLKNRALALQNKKLELETIELRRQRSESERRIHEPTTEEVGHFRRKFIRERGLLLLLIILPMALLVTFTVTTTVQSRRIAREARTADRALQLFVDLLEASDPSVARGDTITLREILDRGAERAEAELGEEPELQARLMGTIGMVYQGLGLYNLAEPLLKRTLEANQRVLGENHRDTLHSMHSLATLYSDQGRYEDAEPLFLEVLEAQRLVLGENHRDTLESKAKLGFLYMVQGRRDKLEPLLQGRPGGIAILEVLIGLLRESGESAAAAEVQAMAEKLRAESG